MRKISNHCCYLGDFELFGRMGIDCQDPCMCKCGNDGRGSGSAPFLINPHNTHTHRKSGKPMGLTHKWIWRYCPLPAKPQRPQYILLQPVPMGFLGSIINRPALERVSQLHLLSPRIAWISSECTLTQDWEGQTPTILGDHEDPTAVSYQEEETLVSQMHLHGLRRNSPQH